MVGDPRAVQPAAPEAGGVRDPLVRLVEARRAVELLGPRKRAVDLVALLQHVSRAHPVTLDAEREIGLQPDRRVGSVGIGAVTMLGDGPLRRDASVVEHGRARQLQLDLAVEAQCGAHEQVLGVFVGRRARVRRDAILAASRAEDQRVADDRPAARRLPRRQQDVRARLVDPRRGDVDAERPEAEVAGLTVEQRAEHARRVEARHAQPVDAAVGRDERAGVAVGEEAVFGDRRERGGGGCALRRAHRARAR
jgi:hypothetical protein